MKNFTIVIIFFLLAAPFGKLFAQQTVNPYGIHTIPAITQDEVGGSSRIKVQFTEPLWTQDKWIVTATTVKAPFNNQWGSWVFHLMTNEAGSEIKLEFYDGTPTNGDNLKLANSTLVSGTGGLPLETPITIEVTSDGTGSLYIFARQGDKTGERTITDIEYVYGVKNDYQREVQVTVSNFEAKIMPVADQNFGYVQAGASAKKTVTVNGMNVSNPISRTLDGADKDFFSITPASVFAGDPFVITFSPTEKREYNATVTLSSDGVDPVSFNLTGSADFDLPVQISTENGQEEHWYYIQFYRKAAANTVWSLSDSTEMIVQDTLKAGVIRNDQQWKICGNWTDGYYLINKTGTDVQISYNELISGDSTKLADRYYKVELGDLFDFVRFGTTNDWQFYNRSYVEHNLSASQTYVNDAGGKFLCHYALNDAGNRLIFISADEPVIRSSVASLTFDLPQGETATQSLSLLGMNLTGNITATISGDDASAFSFGDGGATLPAIGGNLNITFSPTAVKTHTATLTLTSGIATLTIAVTGNSDLGLPTISTPGNDVWYYIQLNRKPTTAFTAELVDGNRYDTRVMQRPKTDDNADQHWKFTGNWTTGYSIINKNGGALSFDDITTKRLILIEEEAFGDKFLFKRENSTSRWQFQVVGKNDGGDAYSYVNDYGGAGGDGSLGLYVVNDGGNLLNFFPADGTDVKFPAFDSNDKIVSVKYYTLTGAEVVRPAVSGIYIVRNVYASGRVKAEKQLFVIK